ncbi:tRNA threonylcarbamoyladenosine dehydratase [Pontibacillus yanchengensis]|uniref:tRNA threonylcarbamoyladenosine dehydratase n=1 Tax=Pontibacillus yanchengensis TaxID=462910 RepID=A0ACC7VER7_9BACI|nr:tRNA threonylcarbamoyladenosine dehydratase [Pontibacillus yanchengensis]MYL53406.1 tRNA threonylcarbamoyladenosine dehydratase [Pontibacillus yanchengensis]
MLHQFSRNELAIGKEGLQLMKDATVAVLGIGGVGSFTVEALARSGVGRIILIDKDDVDITNINRQLHSLLSTVGQSKVDVMAERVHDINPECEVIRLKMFYTEETYERLFQYELDYVIDASDTISYKIHLIKQCIDRDIYIISSMGAANKTDPTQFEIANIFDTSYDPMARVIRNRLRKDGYKQGVPVVYSKEKPIRIREDIRQAITPDDPKTRKSEQPPSSNAFVPSVSGLIMASHVVNTILEPIDIERY